MFRSHVTGSSHCWSLCNRGRKVRWWWYQICYYRVFYGGFFSLWKGYLGLKKSIYFHREVDRNLALMQSLEHKWIWGLHHQGNAVLSQTSKKIWPVQSSHDVFSPFWCWRWRGAYYKQASSINVSILTCPVINYILVKKHLSKSSKSSRVSPEITQTCWCMYSIFNS